MSPSVTGWHHVGLVVHDMAAAIDRIETMGLAVSAPARPGLPADAGLEPLGPANAHIELDEGFVELVGLRGLDGIRLVPLDAPPELRPRILARARSATATLDARLARFEGMHVAMADTIDIDAVAERLRLAGVAHGGVTTVRRPPEEPGAPPELVRFLDLDGADTPEGRIGVAAHREPPRDRPRHPLGATAVVGAVLGVADHELSAVRERYRLLLGAPAVTGPLTVFELDRGRLAIAAASVLPRLLPGEALPASPALVAVELAVDDPAAATALWTRRGVPWSRTPDGAPFAPGTAALGTAWVLRGPSWP